MLRKYVVEFGLPEDAYIAFRYVAREYVREEVEMLRELAEGVMRNIG